ncbi:TIGR02680 family protein [Cohnella rhizosphaerae]|uniref:TIGR02680 family protein n=1 Tax=Cohnella rhizosphaerae TaxID=1457232 RepID=A0A9X4KS06_9BACL|nr:TIGR02680 family protein [Cohnella rhizosphaerae]MDG0809483.1 TIGR02680 family protein [Cohnella rhizosphaerae]
MEKQLRDRWQMNRAGILNFWFYEEEEFELGDGRLVLRGTNGAGKSVTMQSFVPLVLDGDKRPHRLDPFGSKDRKIEYYLLGDQDEHTDRTGYLWLEFVHPAKGLYKTIGIGLRARRGVAQVGFWGFLLEDGRRMGENFWLYDRVLEREGRGKYPLDRRALEAEIGAGGQVVQEQRAYRELVNRALFGYHDKDAYTDLLQLLVQLRSPKLSKDVKPTAIYEILVQALPPLHEEELRPLSEVMEDMDQLADRLDELKLHQAELDKLSRSYEQYNRYLLYRSGEQLLDVHRDREASRRQLSALTKELQEAQRSQTEADAAGEANQAETVVVETELDLLGRSEAMEKQQELEAAEQGLQETERYADEAQRRLTDALRSRERAESDAEKARRDQAEQLGNQRDTLAEMDELTAETEFAHHGVYARYWQPEPPADTAFLGAWRRDVEDHRRTLGEAIVLAEREQEAGRLVADYDRQLGELRAERDLAERASREAEEAADDALRSWKESLLMWKQGLAALRIGDEAVQAMLRASAELSYERQSLEPVLAPVRSEADRQRQALVEAKLALAQEAKLAQEELDRLAADKLAWERQREPEPARSESRRRTRSGYAPGEGAPLYELCEFQAHIGEEQRAGIERALLDGGVLDAWLRADGSYALADGAAEEAWIVAQPLEWGYTLADVLKPTPSAESGLSEAQVEAALRSFAWGEAFAPETLDRTQSAVVGRDYYQLGPIVGKSDGSAHRAQYIGKEARRQFKLAEIARLSQEMTQVEATLAALGLAIGEKDEAIAAIGRELASFPANDEARGALLSAWAVQYEAAMRFKLLLEREHKLADQLRAKQQQWGELKQAFLAAVSVWSRLRTLRDLREALDSLAVYGEKISQLHADWRAYRQRSAEAERSEEQAAAYGVAAELEEERRDELLDKKFALRVKVDQLRKLMEELGIADLHARISGLRARRQTLLADRKRLIEEAKQAATRFAVLLERQSVLAGREQEVSERLERRLADFAAEWRLGLVPETEGLEAPAAGDERQWLPSCRRIVELLESRVGRANKERLSGVLQDQYNASKHLLGEYALEAEIADTGRITLLSMRDRTRPQKPSALLAEMAAILAEQESLLSDKDRELFEEIILRSVGKSIRSRIQRAELWMKTMNKLMAERDTSSGLKLQLQWLPKAAQSENELNSDELVALLRKDAHLLHDDEVERLVGHFRSRIQWAKQGAAEERETLRKHIYDMLDYRSWFQFSLRYKKGEESQYRELTDSRFNVLSGGEKAMSMYIPLFAATYSRYADASPEAPKIISLDEAFAGVDDENIRDLFGLLSEMDFDYMMTSQVLWGCYDTVPELGISEIYRPKDANYVTVFRYRWNGRRLEPLGERGDERRS